MSNLLVAVGLCLANLMVKLVIVGLLDVLGANLSQRTTVVKFMRNIVFPIVDESVRYVAFTCSPFAALYYTALMIYLELFAIVVNRKFSLLIVVLSAIVASFIHCLGFVLIAIYANVFGLLAAIGTHAICNEFTSGLRHLVEQN